MHTKLLKPPLTSGVAGDGGAGAGGRGASGDGVACKASRRRAGGRGVKMPGQHT